MNYIFSFDNWLNEAKAPIPVAQESRDFFAGIALKAAKENGCEISERGNLILYHGTTPANAKKIVKSGKFLNHSFFAIDRETADQYGKMTGRGNHVVFRVEVYAGVLMFNGYYTLNEPIYLDSDNVYKPYDMLISDWIKP